MGRGIPTTHVRHSHVLGTLATIQSSRRTGPSSPTSVLLLVRVDTGRGAVRSVLRRSWDCTDRGRADRIVGRADRIEGLHCIDALHHSATARLVVILVAFYLG